VKAKDHFSAGHLDEALAAVTADVKANPADLDGRWFLTELLCFSGNLDRADKQLDILMTQAPDAALQIALFRQLLRAEVSRREFYAQGRVPEFLDFPTPVQQLHLEAALCLREGKPADAAQLLGQADEQRPVVAGECDGERFEGLRDLDDLTASFLEVLTSNGKYYWIPWERIELIEFRPPERPRDLLWRQAHMIVRGGPDGEVYLPALYFGSEQETEPEIKIGRSTDFLDTPGGPVRGIGQRTILCGEHDRPIMELKTLTVDELGQV
jgi:type VI secretion system protein ImpE